MFRAVPAIVLAVGMIVPITLRAGGPTETDSALAAAEEELDRKLAEAEMVHLQARVAARRAYLAGVVEAKRAAVASGDLDQAKCLADREEQIECDLEADRTAALRIEHELAPRAELVVRGEGFAVKALRNGATAYSNRDYKWANVPEELEGWSYTQIDGGDTPDFRAEVEHGGVAYVMAESLELAEHGWVRRPELAFHWYPGRAAMSVFSKQVEAGQVLDVPHVGWTGTMVLLPREDTQDR